MTVDHRAASHRWHIQDPPEHASASRSYKKQYMLMLPLHYLFLTLLLVSIFLKLMVSLQRELDRKKN